MDPTGSGQGPLVSSCEHSKDNMDSLTDWEFTD